MCTKKKEYLKETGGEILKVLSRKKNIKKCSNSRVPKEKGIFKDLSTFIIEEKILYLKIVMIYKRLV